MPVYTYHCENCDHEFDKTQSFSDNSLRKCPSCKKMTLYKVYKPARVVFKGSGYYVTDNKGKNPAAKISKGENGASESSKNGASENGKSETKESKESKKSESKESSSAKKSE